MLGQMRRLSHVRQRFGTVSVPILANLLHTAERLAQSDTGHVEAEHEGRAVNVGPAAQFLLRYYEAGNAVDGGATWKDAWWMGARVSKLPMDLWIYQEILHAARPDVIVECGTAFGGSALYLANICDLLGTGKVVTVDIDDWDIEVPGYSGRPSHPRITYVKGSSTDPEVIGKVKQMIPDGSAVMVILDSDHSEKHVLEELRSYSPIVTPGQFLIVEDTMLNGNPVHADFGPGPMEALDQFLCETGEFYVDPIGDKFLVSFNPRGYLRRRPRD